MEIKITKSSSACHLSGRPFVHDEEYVSILRLRDGELVREDYARDHWEDKLRKDAYSVWSTRFYDPKVAEQESPEVFSPLRQLFYEAVESEERVEQAKAFLAAQLLRRQKAFRLVKESDETETEVRVSLYADRIGNRLIQVRDPSFSYVEMEQGRQRLLARLQELERPAPPEGEAAAGVDENGNALLSLDATPEDAAFAEASEAAVDGAPADDESDDDLEDEDEFDEDGEFDEDDDEDDGVEDGAGQPGAAMDEEAAATAVVGHQMDAESSSLESREEMHEAKPIHT